MRILIAIDSFKGCLSSVEAGRAARDGFILNDPDALVDVLAVSDGGEGWLEAFEAARGGIGRRIGLEVTGPDGKKVAAEYGIIGGTAVVESARACGLGLVAHGGRNVLTATSYGLGEIVADAVERGCAEVVIGLGGSATSDAGIGMVQALADRWCKGDVDSVVAPEGVKFVVASDVRNPLYGQEGAAKVFGPQKGADAESVELLDRRAKEFAARNAAVRGFDCAMRPGAGAAGGIGYAMMEFLGAGCRSGAEILLDIAGWDNLLNGADLVVTGEGASDRQTLMGKAPWVVMRRASAAGVPTLLIAGKVDDRETLLEAGFAEVECINPPERPQEVCLRKEVALASIRDLMAKRKPGLRCPACK